jgi:hypothetical protein
VIPGPHVRLAVPLDETGGDVAERVLADAVLGLPATGDHTLAGVLQLQFADAAELHGDLLAIEL